MPLFLAIVFSRPALRRCLPTALLVGTILSVINQASVIGNGEATLATWIRVAFNYLTPFVVSNIGFVSAALARKEELQSSRMEETSLPLGQHGHGPRQNSQE
jgi:hypothetical protein